VAEELSIAIGNNYPIFQTSDMSKLVEIALKDLPSDIEEESQAVAWVVKRILELGQQGRHRQRTIQMALVSWIANGDMGRIYQAHPEHYPDLRSFLKSVGTREKGNQLSPSTITEMVTVADIFVPFCQDNDIEFQHFIATDLWTKAREAMTAIKAAIVKDDAVSVVAILQDVVELPSRDAVREKYRSRSNEKFGRSDLILGNGVSVVVTIVPTSRISDIKRALGRYTEWDAFASGTINRIIVNTGGTNGDVHQT